VLPLATVTGLWEFMSNEECVAIASQSREPRLAVEALITEANDRWMKEEQVCSTM
jgi:serine/threonine protein phosphatase PrpC